jgi:hypothetical protein
MSWTLQDLQENTASEMDQSPTAPDEGGTDWNIRKNAFNRALIDWENSNEWDSLKVVFNGNVTVAGHATLGLPDNFKKVDGRPLIVWDGRTTQPFEVLDPSFNGNYTESDLYVNVFDNSRDGKFMYIHANTLSSGASVQFTYYKSPQSLASATDLVECPDPTYVLQRALYYIYKGREDGRFPEAKTEADKILARMMENEAARGLAYKDRSIPNELGRSGFRIGRD